MSRFGKYFLGGRLSQHLIVTYRPSGFPNVLRSPTGNRPRAVKPGAIKLTLGVSLLELTTPDSVAHSSVRRELDKPVGATAVAGAQGIQN